MALGHLMIALALAFCPVYCVAVSLEAEEGAAVSYGGPSSDVPQGAHLNHTSNRTDLENAILTNQLAILKLLNDQNARYKETDYNGFYITLNSERFFWYQESAPWDSARLRCELVGGRLAEPANAYLLALYLRHYNAEAHPGNYEHYHWWVGSETTGTQYSTELHWISGRAVPYSHIKTDHIEPFTKSCLLLSLVLPPLEYVSCSKASHFLCQF